MTPDSDFYHTYDDCRENLIAALRRDAVLHEVGRYEDLGAGLPEVLSQLSRGEDDRYRKLRVAFRFWDAWLMARDSDWLEHCHIELYKWPQLAVRVADDLEADRNIAVPEVLQLSDIRFASPITRRGHQPGKENEASGFEPSRLSEAG
jgi:hypothetical protein